MELYDEQTVLNKIIHNYVDKEMNTQAYILVGNDEKMLQDKAKKLAKVFVCPNKYDNNCSKCNICMRIDNNEFNEVKIINPINNVIKKEAVIDVKNTFQTNSIEGKNQIYIINCLELLNQSSSNSILKFLEEPDSNTIAIFTTTNIDKVINTIASRCQIIRLKNKKVNHDFAEIQKICGLEPEKIEIGTDLFVKTNHDYKSVLIDTKDKILKSYDSKQEMLNLLKLFLLLYKNSLEFKNTNDEKCVYGNELLKNYSYGESSDKIIKKISFILENMKKLDYNVNMLLFINNLVIGIGEITNDKCDRN